MSLPSSPNSPAPIAQKQGTNIYTVMLILAFLALTTGSILLYSELSKYGSFPYWSATGS
jgi:hypothetical protein